LLAIPWVHSQVELLTSRAFIREAKKWGQTIGIKDLDELTRLRLLVPFYRIDAESVSGRTVDVVENDHSPMASYARAGQVRDPQIEGRSAWWPQLRPEDSGGDWTDGYYYSTWQILGIRTALNARSFYLRGHPIWDSQRYADKERREHLALAALSARHFPSIVGKVHLRGGAEFATFGAARFEADDKQRLAAAGYDPRELRKAAEYLLNSAHHSDPMAEWWPVIRHSDHSGWFKMRGQPLYCLWQRLAAETMLRAHEHLADAGELDSIPDLAIDAQMWSPLHERITVRGDAAEGLDRGLGKLGISPHPRVILVLEGETEMIHLSALLAEFGIIRPNLVRLVKLRTSSDRPRQLARYAVSPRLDPPRRGRRPLAATPTGLHIAMDPEGPWRDGETRDRERKKLQQALREDVEAQGAQIAQDELDVLIQVFVWGDHKYELANFTDEQLEDALSILADRQNVEKDDGWRDRLNASVQHARSRHLDIKVVFLRMRLQEQKAALAELLLPHLLQLARDATHVDQLEGIPVLKLVLNVRDQVEQLSGSGYTLDAGSRAERVDGGAITGRD
jgi:hypothetical protein